MFVLPACALETLRRRCHVLFLPSQINIFGFFWIKIRKRFIEDLDACLRCQKGRRLTTFLLWLSLLELNTPVSLVKYQYAAVTLACSVLLEFMQRQSMFTMLASAQNHDLSIKMPRRRDYVLLSPPLFQNLLCDGLCSPMFIPTSSDLRLIKIQHICFECRYLVLLGIELIMLSTLLHSARNTAMS